MAYIYFRDNYILPKDITNYILTFLGPTHEEINFIKEMYYFPCWEWVKYQKGMYKFLKEKHRWTFLKDSDRLTSFHNYLLPALAMKRSYLLWLLNSVGH
jgi:hypothetical protein